VKRWLPHPLASLLLLGAWLLLVQDVSAGQILLGALLGGVGPLVARPLGLPSSRAGSLRAWVRLAGRVLADVFISNLRVAWLALAPARRGPRAGFVPIQLELRAPWGLATLACIITATPGTCWAGFDSERGVLVIHVLDLRDDDDWSADIKRRYETLLLEIFE
jgi:multicomponent K+:H+ antiporter subunit E